MSRIHKIGWSLFGIIAIIAAVGVYSLADKAAASPSRISQPGSNRLSTAPATTTPVFQTAGTATSTLTLDTINGFATTTLNIDTSFGDINATAVDSAILLVQNVGSSTDSYFQLNWEFSQDGINFYQDFLNGTSTRGSLLSQAKNEPFSQLFRYSSSTSLSGVDDGDLPDHVITLNPLNTYAISVPDVPTRYVRAVITTPLGSLNNTFWMQYVTRVQR